MGEIAAQGRVGRLLGMNVVVDPSMPTNQGAGANQDPVIVMPASDQILWESTVPRRSVQGNQVGLAGRLPARVHPRRIYHALCEVDLDHQRHRSGQPDIRIVIDFTWRR